MIMRSLLAAAALSLVSASAAHADLLDDIKARGGLTCGTLNYLPGVGFLDD